MKYNGWALVPKGLFLTLPVTRIHRLLLAMLLEAVRTLEERIVREPMHVDMGLILGIGFPPFRGGLLKWCDNVGAAKLLERIKKYIHLGKRFEPTEKFVEMASSGAKFYPRKA